MNQPLVEFPARKYFGFRRFAFFVQIHDEIRRRRIASCMNKNTRMKMVTVDAECAMCALQNAHEQ